MVRVLCVDTFVRGLCVDINRLDVAKTDKNSKVKDVEEVISRGLILLSQFLKDNLTLERECVLTAFSLTPTEELFKKITQLAEQSGFVDSGIIPVDNCNKDEEKRLEKVSVPFTFDSEQFDTMCEQEETLLSKGFGHGRSKFRANANVQEKRKRNLEGLVSIQVKNGLKIIHLKSHILTGFSCGILFLTQNLMQRIDLNCVSAECFKNKKSYGLVIKAENLKPRGFEFTSRQTPGWILIVLLIVSPVITPATLE